MNVVTKIVFFFLIFSIHSYAKAESTMSFLLFECTKINKVDFDKVFETNGLKVVCDLKSWLYLKNITVDYSDDMLTGGFKIKNPNADRTCGCGTSFSA